MQFFPITSHPAGCGSRCTRAITLLVALFAFLVSAQAQAGGGRHHGWGGPDGWIEHHAEALGLDDETLAQIQEIADASREQAEAIYEEHRNARDAMHGLLDRDEPDRAAVMKQAEVLAEIDLRKHKHRLATMLDIHAKLTPEQRTKLREMKDEMRERRGGGPKCDRGACCRRDGPPGPPSDEL